MIGSGGPSRRRRGVALGFPPAADFGGWLLWCPGPATESCMCGGNLMCGWPRSAVGVVGVGLLGREVRVLCILRTPATLQPRVDLCTKVVAEGVVGVLDHLPFVLDLLHLGGFLRRSAVRSRR